MTDAAYDPWAAAAEEAEANSKRNEPVPAGTYDFTVFEYELGDYASDSTSRYAGEKALKMQLRISDGQPQANRRLFPKIGLFPRYLPSDKNPQGAVNEDLFTFFQKAMGWSLDDIKGFVVAAKAGDGQTIAQYLRRIAGAPLSGRVRVVPDTRTNAAPDAKQNEVRGFAKAKGVTGAAGAAAGAPSADIWNTGASAAPAAAQPVAQPAATPTQHAPAAASIWGVTPEQAAAATPAAPQQDPALAAAAAATAGY